jgi:hypothetical protein
MNYLKKYGKRELERFAYLRLHKGLSNRSLYDNFHKIKSQECEDLTEWIKEHPKYIKWRSKWLK